MTAKRKGCGHDGQPRRGAIGDRKTGHAQHDEDATKFENFSGTSDYLNLHWPRERVKKATYRPCVAHDMSGLRSARSVW
jgi:hypothetical protein